jgi:hypothetical protein
MLVDQHYYAIASKATLVKPAEMPVPADKFQAAFGLSWHDALKAGSVHNALDACKVLGLDSAYTYTYIYTDLHPGIRSVYIYGPIHGPI